MQYGSILAKQFDVPQQRQQAAATGRAGRPAGGGGPADFKFDDYGLKPFDGLDRSNPDVAQAAQQYYQDWAALRSFAKTMWVKYGVDVMSPDPGDENAIWANQAFNQKLALLMNNVDRAKNDFEVWKADQAAQREGKMLGRDYMGSASTMGLTERGTPIFPESPATANLMKGAQNITPGQAAAANTDITNQIAQYEGLAKQAEAQGDKATAEYYRQQAAIAQPLKVVAAENTPRSDYSAQYSNTGSAIKEWALLAEGSNRYFTLPERPSYTKEGRPLYEAVPTGWVGTQFGTKTTGANKGKPFTVAKLVYDYGAPGGGQAYFEDAEGERKEMDKRNIVAGMREYINSNKGGFSLADFNKFLAEQKLGGDILPSRRLLDQFEAQEVMQSQQAGAKLAQERAPAVKAAFDSYLAQVDELAQTKPRSVFGVEIPFTSTAVRDDVQIPLVNGQTALIKIGENGTYRLDNWASLFPKDKQSITVKDRVISKNEATKLSKEDLFELLNYIGIDVNQATPAQPSNPWSQYKKQTP